MSTVGSSFAAVDNQQTAENITNSVSIEKNTTTNEYKSESVKNSSTETQKTEQATDKIPQTTGNSSITEKTSQNESEVTQTNQNTETRKISDAIPVHQTVDNSKISTENVQNEVSQDSVNTESSQNTEDTVNQEPQAAGGENYTNIRGIWLKAEDAGNITVAELKNANITDIFVKTNLISAPTYHGVLKDILNKFQNSGIRIHAWITCFKDANGKWINPANSTQRSHLLNAISDILNYNINGIHLDYVRYSGVGDNAAYKHNGTEVITSFVRDVKQLIQAKKPKVALSAAVMPEGASNANQYGQDYGQLAKYVDFLAPMIYKGNYGKDTSWIGTATKYIVDHAVNANGNKIPVLAGLQTYVSDYDTTLLTADELHKDVQSAIENGASGYVLFRYGLISQDFLKPPTFTLNEVKDAASRLKTFIETNKRLPNYVTVATTRVKMSDFLNLMTKSVLQLNNGITSPLTLKNVMAPQNSTGSFKSGSITKTAYIDMTNRINSFIDTNGQAPNYATTTLGKIPYEHLVYIYSKILNFHNSKNRLPNYVTMDPNMKISPPTTADLSVTKFTVDQIKKAAANVKNYIETNHKLPNYVTVGNSQVAVSDFLRLLVMGTIEVKEGSYALISLKTVNAPATPNENINKGTIDQAGYIDIAKRVKAFIDANGALPNHVTTPLGEMRFESLIYMFSKVLSFQDANSRLPNYVSVVPWREVASPPAPPVPAELQKYLAATLNCQVNDPKIKALAASITNGKTSAYDKSVAIFNWVRDNISYSFYPNTRRGALRTLNDRTGNCVDQAHLLIALSRAAGIPAKYMHGRCTFTSGNTYGHVWAEVWVNGRWYSVDTTSSRNRFGVINNWNTKTVVMKGNYVSLPF
jgi:uncharacterized protein YpmS